MSDFSNNPFSKLQIVQPKKENIIVQGSTKKNSPQKVVAEQTICEDEEQLFLQAVQNVKVNSKQNNAPCLAQHETFAKLNDRNSMHKKQKKKTEKNNIKNLDTQVEITKTVQEDDEADFIKAMQEVLPLVSGGRDIAPEVKTTIAPNVAEDNYKKILESNVEFALALKGEYLEGHVVGLDEVIMNSLRAGTYSPEAHLDLHGLNAMQAYNSLVAFFRGSWYKGLRTVLIVPGRGKNSLNGFGILRDKLQTWLTQEPFKRVVLAFCTARPIDGGPGSVYVLLRKYKKKGKIHWERMPSDPDLF